jgi:acetyl esterase/lipase
MERPKLYRCLICYYGLMDLRLYRKNISNKIPEETLEKYSPVVWLNKSPELLPLFIAKTGKDRTPEIPLSIDKFVGEAGKHGINTRLVTHDKGKHAFDALDGNERTREIIREKLAFLKENLK